MNTFAKTSLVIALGGAVLASSVTASSARNWRPLAAGAAGFAVGAAVGAAAASANRGYYYNQGYAYQQPGYAYDGYAYSGDTYVVEPSYGYGYRPYGTNSNYNYNNNGSNCVSDTGYGRTERCN